MNATTSSMTLVHGRPAVLLRAPDGAQATVMLQGGQVVSWLPAGGPERLYLSDRAVFADGQAVRGGVPVIFPQFAKRGPLDRHGFARTMNWQLLRAETGADDAMAVLGLSDDERTRALWPHEFALELTVSVSGQRLDLELEVLNRSSSAAFSFMAALHTYVKVREIEETQLVGLRGSTRLDLVRGGPGEVEGRNVLTFDGEVDHLYQGACAEGRSPLRLTEPHRELQIETLGFPDVVVWNPWETRSAALPDMPALGFRHMLCVEAAVIGEPVTLAPGEEWWGRQSLLA